MPATPPSSTDVRVRHGQVNVQQTDPLALVRTHIRSVAENFDVIVWNELGKPEHKDAVRRLTDFDSYIPPGSRGSVAISWKRTKYRKVESGSIKVHGGVLKITPTRVINWVLLEDIATKRRFYAIGTHVVHHIEVGGRARIKGAILGQNSRAKKHFRMLADTTAQLGVQHPVIGSGDLNVDYFAEKRLAPSKRTAWFPLTVLGAISGIVVPTHGTHGSRAIDWVWTVGSVKVTEDRTLPKGSSDHNPRLTVIDL